MKDGSTAEIESSPLSLSDRERARLHGPFAKSIETLTRFGDGLAERRRGRLTEATGRLERAVKPDADFAEAWGWLGIVQMEAGRLKEAAESLTRALSLLRAREGEGEARSRRPSGAWPKCGSVRARPDPVRLRGPFGFIGSRWRSIAAWETMPGRRGRWVISRGFLKN